ncbi:hypothetical protein [Prauserella marina]|uniref:hypothetical protein n=1 Tax=Prauserella marina TaxID=530584 RepID=UPI001474E0B9|nr:hypothetical protein [Prauserella marina]
MNTDPTDTDLTLCSKCGTKPAGPGGVLCDGCRGEMENAASMFWQDHPHLGSPS